ncbi:MAG: hypothetical protein Q7U54_17865 [Bacteroidales bacterium]|nr:hypothetical protein [Bacteroidales bacterium]
MIPHSYPARFLPKIIFLFLATILFIFGCKKDNEKKSPTLQLISNNEYIADSTVVAIGFPYKIGINAGKGDAAITNLVVTLTTENGMETALDSGMYSNDLNYTRSASYGASRFEKWSFTLRDKNGKSANASITILKDETSAFGPITTYSSVKLSAQADAAGNSFFSVTNGNFYTQQTAEANQSDINIITYFGDLLVPSTEFTLSSPGESDVITFYPMIANWSIPKNETRYKPDSLSISQGAFDAAYNDSTIISNYTSATIGKRKFKIVRAGYVIPFQVTIGPSSGKRGLIKIKSIQEGTGGHIIADIKVQK